MQVLPAQGIRNYLRIIPDCLWYRAPSANQSPTNEGWSRLPGTLGWAIGRGNSKDPMARAEQLKFDRAGVCVSVNSLDRNSDSGC
jgi:hypothetical protein